MKISAKILFLFLFILGISSCNTKKETPLKIALSKGYPVNSYQNYYDWVKSADSTIIVSEMYNHTLKEALNNLENCDALILTGGEDVYPGNYGKESDTGRCGRIDFKRDSLEFALIKKALELKMPVFGICRGEQILNVALGGSLIIDIPTDFDTTVIHRGRKHFHEVSIEPGTKFAWATNVSKGTVNSYHHQAVDRLAESLKVSARSTDGLIEAIEWKNPEGKSFLMAVQWHPERLGRDNPLSWNLLELFVHETNRYREKDLD